MLVFAMNVSHAKKVSESMNAMFGTSFSNWIGVGPNGRSDTENTNILNEYRANKLPCLVQVDIAGEGFDNPRSSVLLFLHLLRKATVKALQQAGRGLRRNYAIASFVDDKCDIFASPDTEMADLAKDLAARTLNVNDIGDPLTETSVDEEGNPIRKGTPLYGIPPFDPTISDVEFEKSQIISKINEAMVIDFKEKNVAVGNLTKEDADGLSDTRLKEMIVDYFKGQIEDTQQPLDKTFKERVSEAQSILVSNILRLRYGASVQKNLAGDLH